MEQQLKKRQSRRSFLKKAGGIAGAAVVGPLIITDKTIAQTRTVYVNTWGGSLTQAQDEAFYKPFTKATGIRVVPVTPVSYVKLKAQVTSGHYEWDITSINQSQWLRAEREGLVEPIDWDIVGKDWLWPGAVFANGIASTMLSSNICYRKEKFPNGGPKNWADFWDVKKFPGTRSLYDGDPVQAIMAALMADGVPKDKLYPLDLDRAFKKLEEIKPHIKVFWREGTQSQQLLRDGEIDLMLIWNARASELQAQGLNIELVWDQAINNVTLFGVAKKAPNAKLAWEYLKFCLQPKPLAEYAQKLYYGPCNPKAYEFIPEATAKNLPTYPRNLEIGVSIDPLWGADNLAKVEERYASWKSS